MKNKLPNINSNTGRFIDGNPNTGTLGTIVTAEWLNGVQERVQDVFEELRNVLLLGNMQPDGVRQNQVAEAIKAYCNNINLKVQSNTRNFDNYIPNSKKSNSVTSNSADTVATSIAVKTSYDKGVEAKNIADAAYKVEKTNQNQNLNNLLGQNTVFGIAGRAAGTTGLGDIYNYGVGIAINAAGANATLYIPHSHTNSNNGVWVQSSFTGSATNPFWRRIDGADWSDIRGNPLTIQNNLDTANLNNVVGIGIYGQHSYTNATTNRNYPDQVAGSLLVMPFGTGLIQEYTSSTTGYKYIRAKGGSGAWGNWLRIDGIDKVNKSGDTMTGPLEINAPDTFTRFKRNGENMGFVGTPNATSENIKLHSYKHDTFLELQAVKAYINKALELAGNIAIKSGDYSSVELFNRANKRLIFEVSPDSTSSIGNIIYRNASNSNEANVSIPRKTGTMALISDIKNIVVLQGVINHGGTLPLPSGFNESQCKFIISTNNSNPSGEIWDWNESFKGKHYRNICELNGRVVTCQTIVNDGISGNGAIHTIINGKANYMVIGVK